MKKLTVIILCCLLLAVTASIVITRMPKKEVTVLLSDYWTKGSAAAERINEYIRAVTDKLPLIIFRWKTGSLCLIWTEL